MIVDGRTIATILIYIFTFVGYLLGKNTDNDILKKIKVLERFKESWNCYDC